MGATRFHKLVGPPSARKVMSLPHPGHVPAVVVALNTLVPRGWEWVWRGGKFVRLYGTDGVEKDRIRVRYKPREGS